MTDDELVSVIIPVYNGRDLVNRAIDSVLDQTYGAVEAVVVNDGSTDGTAEVLDRRAAEDARVRVVHQDNGGLSAARNAGIASARGAYINFLDADDWLLEHKLRLQVDVLQAAPEVDLVYSDFLRVRDSDGVVFGEPRREPPRPIAEVLVYRNWLAPMVPLLRRSLVERVGGFDATFRAAEDWDYWYRCAQAGRLAYVAGVVAMYRMHGGQMHRDRTRMTDARRRFAHKHFALDPIRMRRCMSYNHLDDARYHKARGAWLACGADLVRYLAAAGSLNEARFVWGLP